MKEETELLKRLSTWISKEGIPLEYFTASIFADNGFRVFQSDFVLDSGSTREIDVLAYKDFNFNETLLRIHAVVECKWTKEKPWIVFTSPTARMAESAIIAQTIGSTVGASVLWHMAGEETLSTLKLFERKESNGFSGRQAFSNDTDLFYATVQSIINKTLLSVKKYENSKDPFHHISIGFPIIVIDGILFESQFVNENVELREVKISRLHWRGSNVWKYHSIITIITKDYLSTFLPNLKEEFDIIGKVAASSIDNIKFFEQTGDVNVLKYKEAPRGIGFPSFLNNIAMSRS